MLTLLMNRWLKPSYCAGWGSCLGGILLPVLCLALASSPVLAQGSPVYYSQHRSFLIPFQMDPAERRIQQVLLHVSEDLGKTYQKVAAASPADASFRYQARRDGWFWFTVQTQDTEGRFYPADVSRASPGLKVCVDTEKPVVTLRAVEPTEGTVGVEWDIKDDNLDLLSLRLEYRPTGAGERDWIPLDVRQLAHAQYGWTPTVSGKCEVRLRVWDKAKNGAEATTTVTPPAGSRPAPEGRGKVIHVRSRTFQLNYTIENEGPSKVKEVQVWVTRDTRSWQKLPDNARPVGPHTVTVATAGTWGFTLVPRSGVGLGPATPRVGEQPHIWVEVDETKPLVRLENIIVGKGADSGKLTIYYSATDKFLRARPISIFHGTKPDGPWTPLETGLENKGSYVCKCEGLPYEFYVRIEAIDEAGNVGSAQSRELIKVDLKIPTIGSVSVTAGETTPPPPPP
jgi:hypothetical protein